MFVKSILNSVKRSAAEIIGADRGNVAAIFAIALVPMLGIVGAAIDYSRAVAARSAMQAALDTTALMVSKDAAADPTLTKEKATEAAQKYFKALYKADGSGDVTISATFTPNTSGSGSTVSISSEGKIATDFMKMAGYPQLNIRAASTATWGNSRLRIAMALDVTGSMARFEKLDKMKIAAKQLVDVLKASAKSEDDIYLSIIPFNVMVNVGTSNSNASWLNWDTSYGSCSKTSYTTKSDCTANGKVWKAKNVNSWKGCVTDRAQNYDTKNDAPVTSKPDTLYLAQNYSQCPSSLLPMMSVFDANEDDDSRIDSTIKGKINNLTAVGNTNQGIGMQIAWMMLQPTGLFTAPAKDPNYQYNDVIILLSDGDNTQNRWYSKASQIDARQRLLCDNINPSVSDASTKETTVYTIQVNTDGDAESAVLKYCADVGRFYPTTTTDGMAAAFRSIGNSLVQLHLKK